MKISAIILLTNKGAGKEKINLLFSFLLFSSLYLLRLVVFIRGVDL